MSPSTPLRPMALCLSLSVLTCSLLLLLLVLPPSAAKVHVHLVPHTHNDVGWLKTVDQYYMGSNKTYDPHAAVQYILESIIPALLANPDRRFIYVEQGFFQRWWRQQSPAMQSTVKDLVAAGRLEFINGGWCMHDEAATHYIDMIDQTTLGHRYILEQFGVTPTIGWQVDPFGHSLTQAALLGYDVGFDAVVLGRIDYQEHIQRTEASTLEFVWRGSPSATDPANAIFAQATDTGGYNAPRGLCFDSTCNDPPVQDDPRLTDWNVDQRVNDFVTAAWAQGNHSNCAADDSITCNLMWLMGEDFQYENANEPFTSLDKIIKYVNQDHRVTTQYSTPSLYFRAKNAENLTWTVTTADFFPYASAPHSYWTGYLTSRPALKRMVRTSSAFLLLARQVEVFAGATSSNATSVLEEAVAVSQHHDAVAGTSRQHVAYDYAQRLSKGLNQADAMVSKALAAMVGAGDVSFTSCPLLNISLCSTQGSLPRIVLLYNPLTRNRTELVRLPVNTKGGVLVLDSTNSTVPSALAATFMTSALPSGSAPFTLSFYATVPALGFTTYFLTASSTEESREVQVQERTAEAVTLANQWWSIGFDSSGLIANITDLTNNVTHPFTQAFYTYTAGSNGGQNAGAYVLLPTSSTPDSLGPPTAVSVVSTSLVQEARQTFSGWLYQTIRLEEDRIAFEWTVGELPCCDVGHEVITRYSSSITSAGQWWSDNNGREMIQRLRDARQAYNYTVEEPVAGNYVPVNAACGLNDTRASMWVLVDRAEGCTSLNDGQVEFLLHRRLFKDDSKGLYEVLNETESIIPGRQTQRLGKGLVVTGTHYLILRPTPVQRAANEFRALQSRIYSPLHLLSAPLQSASVPAYLSSHTATKSFLTTSLPPELELITLQQLNATQGLVRFAHSYGRHGIDESDLSVKVGLNLTASVFARPISNWREVSLSANQRPAKQRPQYTWRVQGEDRDVGRVAAPSAAMNGLNEVVGIDAMEIVTFLVDFAAAEQPQPVRVDLGERLSPVGAS